MIEIQQIRSKDKRLYHYMEQLLQDSFPHNEYRDLNELLFYTDNRSNFYCNVIYYNKNLIGVLNYWEFAHFFYIEHLAITSQERNKQYGGKVLERLKQILNKPIILEVELPENEDSTRRINFYERHGFELWDCEYLQPPYKKGEGFLPLRLMAIGDLNKKSDFEHIKATLYSEVYNYTIPYPSKQP